MLKKFSKRMSAFIIALTLTLMSVPLATHAASDDVITIIHTNDMHGRLAEKVNTEDDGSFAYTKLAGLRKYAEDNKADLILDAGDAIQGLPISNISKGEYMIRAMKEVGYYAMTVGNHEFDFGQDQILSLRNTHQEDDKFYILSNNTKKDSNYIFDRSTIVEVKGNKVGIIGVTTPETKTKSHPKNTEGIVFTDPLEEVMKDINSINKSVDYIVVLAHLGQDGTTKNSERGDILADSLSNKNVGKPILVIDGHSHTVVEKGKTYPNHVLYVQSGDYLNNLGHVTIDLADFSKSTAKLVDMKTLDIAKGSNLMLDAEKAAEEAYDSIAGEVLIDNFPFDMTSDGAYARTQEIALGNLIADAMMDYGQDFEQVPDLAVINGGGIRADLKSGKVTYGDIISILPFGNMYSSITVTGEELVAMFEHSIRGNVVVDDDGMYVQNDDGTYLLDRNGGFLQVSGASFNYNPFYEPGNRVKYLEIGGKPVELDKTYVLATNDFLAAGGDGYTMLSGARVEGEGLEQILVDFLKNEKDFSEYENQFPLTRIVPETYNDATASYLVELLEETSKLDRDKYTDESLERLDAAILAANKYIDDYDEGDDLYEHEILELIYDIEDAIKRLEEVPVEEPTPSEPEEPKEPEKPEPKPTEPDEGRKDDAKPSDNLPATGSVSLAYPAIILVALGIITKVISKRRE